VLAPDVVDRLARDRDPATRFAGDLDHTLRVPLGSAIALPRKGATSGTALPEPALSSGARFRREDC
jgi:hypothetical protein